MAEVIQAPADMSRALRRRIERLTEEVERITQADAAFFRRRPDRQHRLRFMSAAEHQQVALMTGKNIPLPAGKRWAVAMRQVAPGARVRIYVPVPISGDMDLPEEACRRIYELATSIFPQVPRIEAEMARSTGEARS